jgi:glutathione S-transferase
MSALLSAVFGSAKFDTNAHTRSQNDSRSLFNMLNEHLKTRTVLVGQTITAADLAVASKLVYAFRFVFDEKFRTAFVNLTRWFSFITAQ